MAHHRRSSLVIAAVCALVGAVSAADVLLGMATGVLCGPCETAPTWWVDV